MRSKHRYLGGFDLAKRSTAASGSLSNSASLWRRCSRNRGDWSTGYLVLIFRLIVASDGLNPIEHLYSLCRYRVRRPFVTTLFSALGKIKKRRCRNFEVFRVFFQNFHRHLLLP